MEVFYGANDHYNYLEWLNRYEEEGYVLQVNQQSDMKLHRAECPLIGAQGAVPPNGEIWTSYRKLCSLDRQELMALSTHQCQKCRP